jgi:fibronectin-binding autotransporter adhesin
VGIKGANIAIINAGTISGGAVDASGGAPVAGKPSSLPVGSIRWRFRLAQPSPATWWLSAPPILSLGGDTNASFDVSQIGAGAKYDGFGFFGKTGNSTWTLTGTTTAITPWTLSGGILQISSDSNLGATARRA